MNWIRLGVTIGVIALAVISISQGYGVIETSAAGLQASMNDGVAGPLSWLWQAITWIVYALFVALVVICLAALLSSFGILAWVTEKAFGSASSLVSKVSSAWQGDAPDPMNQFVATKEGHPITLGQIIQDLDDRLERTEDGLQRASLDISNLEDKTAGIEPPPPQKTPEEENEELRVKLAQAERALAEKESKEGGAS